MAHPAGKLWARSWRLARVRLWGMARRGLGRAGAALQTWASPQANPFLQRAWRLETRRHKPLLTVLGAACAVLLLNVVFWWAWGLWKLPGTLVQWPPFSTRLHEPRAWGTNLAGLTAILAAAACAYSILWAVQARAAYLLRQELLKDTLAQLQLLPLAEERWLWMMSAHPLALALLIGLVGAPFYVAAVVAGQWSLPDVLGLFLVFAALGHVAPLWQPRMWQGQGKRGRVDPKRMRQALLQARSDFELVLLSAAQRLELQRRTARLLNGAAEVESSTDTATPAANSSAKPQPRGGAKMRGDANWMRGLGWWFGVQLLVRSVGVSGARGGTGFLAYLGEALPGDIVALLPGLVWTWPLALARLLLAPLPFFAFHLPPLLLLGPLCIGLAHQKIMGLASNVSVAETFWTARRARRRQTIDFWLRLASLLLIAGYGWRFLVDDALLASLLPGAPPTPDYALAAGWTSALVAATIMVPRQHEDQFQRAAAGLLPLSTAARLALTRTFQSFALVGIGYFAACVLGGAAGNGPAWQSRLLPTLATAASFAIAWGGVGAVRAALPRPLQTAWNLLSWVWFQGLALEALARVLLAWTQNRSFSLDEAPHVLLSPYVSLFTLFRLQLGASGGVPAWWWGPLWQSAAGAALLLTAIAATRPAREGAADGGWLSPILAMLDTLERSLRRLLRALAAPFRALSAWMRVGLQRIDEAIISWGARTDNPVLLAELRRRLNKQRWSLQWLAFFVCASLLIFGLLVVDPPGVLLSVLRSGIAGNWIVQDAARILAGCVLASLWLLAGTAVLDLGQAFDRDRLNGTLVFLFLTPLHDRTILIGKLVPALIYSLGLLATALPWLLAACLAAALSGGSDVPVWAICGTLAALSTLPLSATLQLFFAVRATRPTEGSAKAFLCGAVIEGAAGLGFAIFTDQSVGATCATFIAITLGHLLLAALAWRSALGSLRRQRYGDVTAMGKGVA